MSIFFFLLVANKKGASEELRPQSSPAPPAPADYLDILEDFVPLFDDSTWNPTQQHLHQSLNLDDVFEAKSAPTGSGNDEYSPSAPVNPSRGSVDGALMSSNSSK